MILVNGCSFTAAADDNDTWVKGLYSKELFKYRHDGSIQHGAVRNVAAGGSSNLVIRRKTFWHINCDLTKQKPDYAIIQWSTIDRWDYPVFVNEERAKTFPRLDMRPDWVNKINYMNNGTDTFGYGKNFYENYYSVFGAVLETLEHIYHTQQYLESSNIPYKMITIGNLFNMDVSVEKLINLQKREDGHKGDYSSLNTEKNIFDKLEECELSWKELNIIDELLQKIDFKKFIFTDDVNIKGFGGGIIEWFLNKNEMLTGGGFHPSEEQHLRFFEEFLWPKIESDINEYKSKKI
jgi:hypothetical protein